jgi:hypothetical protein
LESTITRKITKIKKQNRKSLKNAILGIGSELNGDDAAGFWSYAN